MGDRYSILGAIAKGGMAQVYLGRMVASAGFSRLVAIKRLHESLSEEPEFVAMLLDEARLTARIRHTNVVDILDVVVRDGAFALVLEWVEGAAVNVLFKRAQQAGEPVPRAVVVAIMIGVLRGLAAAHEARAEDGTPLGIVHRDVSPQNVLVGVDGIPRIIDFGVAKAFGKLEATRPGEIRGKYAYMAPEQLMGRPVTNQVDVYAAGVMMWELVTGKRLFKADDERVVIANVMQGKIDPPSTAALDVSPELDAIVMKAVAREPSRRYLDAREMLADVEKLERASEEEVGAWVRSLAADTIESHQQLIQRAAPPSSPRSLEALLSELAPAPSGPLPPTEVRGPVSVPGPLSNLDTGDVTERQLSPPLAASRRDAPRAAWVIAIAAAVGLLLAAVLLGVVSLRRASTRSAQAASAPVDAPPTPVAVAPVPPPASEPSEAAAGTSAKPSASPPEPSPSPSIEMRPTSTARPTPKSRPRAPTPQASGDPTDRR
ncbi:MAG: serine/threonine protein kinase [Deltaproteobacteria bacterium]|nr:serine/threonine protein kinase [Deltaproteobacteria bacterium]